MPDNHLETALDVMSDMVFAPRFDDVDSEREVVLEEIAMYEDTPQELVHDLFSEAVFGSHALGRPVIGTRDVISTVPKRTISTLPPHHVHAGQHRHRRRRQPRSTSSLLALLEEAQREGDATDARGRACARRS